MVYNYDGDVMTDIFDRLACSRFRSSFRLKSSEIAYIKEKGLPVIRRHAYDFIDKRLAPAEIPNDGKQTPVRGHPVFIAQHATATCCRGCLYKWHGIVKGKKFSDKEREYVVDVIMEWIIRQL